MWRHDCYNKKLVVTNGTFGFLHPGHVHYLKAARAMGDLLLVGLNSDSSVIQLKGKDRLLVKEEYRAMVLAELECVDAVCIFYEKRATEFLRRAKPDVWVKGGDYTRDTLDSSEVLAVGESEIVLVPLLEGYSTTGLFKEYRQESTSSGD